ncbi:MAG TPA: hypothetical protein DDW31_01870 [candidate division Zixibacteria bacterium]|nr:hypothetical protein [candidate division Zixibacteria bacterium]
MRRTVVAACLGLLAAGCYSFTGGQVPFRTVAIPSAANATAEYRLPELVTKAMFEAVERDGRMKLSEPKAAQGRYEIEITGYQHQPYVYDRQEAVRQYRVTITAKAALRAGSGKAVWEGASVSGWAVYAPDSLDEPAGMQRAAANLAEEITRQSLETW